MFNHTTDITENYQYFIHELEDPRIKNWFFISSPLPTLTLITIYLILIYKYLPRYMKNRKPFDLTTTIRFYNIFQIVSCTVLVYKVCTENGVCGNIRLYLPFVLNDIHVATMYIISGEGLHIVKIELHSEPSYVWKCEYFQYSQDAVSLKRLNLSYCFYLIKAVELIETVFFMLRKKYNQVSTLHVYHHITTLSMAWFYAKYFAGGMVSFCMMLNSSVHIFMYTYYLLASLGPDYQKYIQKWKSALTMMQMTQLSLLIIHSSQVLFDKDCGLPKLTFYLYAPNVAIMFYMFRNFYRKSYSKKQQ